MTSGAEPRTALSMISTGPFARLWWASLISSTGDWIAIFATIALGNDIAGSQGVLVVVVSRIVPGLVFGALVGVITDRVDRRRLIVIADLGRAAIVPMMLFASTLPILVLITIVTEFLSLLGQSPRAAIVPRLVRPANIVNANSLILGATYATIPLGAAFNWFLAALPTATLGGLVPEETAPFALAFLVDAATFVISGIIVSTLPTQRTKHAEAVVAHDEDVSSTWEDLRDGGRFLWRTRSVRRVIASMTAALFGGGVIIAVGPKFVETVLASGTTGFFAVVTALGGGAGLGIILVSLYGSRLARRDVVFAFATLLAGVGLTAAALTETVFGASAWIFAMGFGAGAAYVMGLTHLHESVDDEMRGRVFAALFALMRIGIFVSILLAVPVEAALASSGVSASTRVVLFAGGLTIVLAGLMTVWSLRHLLRRPKLDSGTRDVLEETTRAVLPRRSDDAESQDG